MGWYLQEAVVLIEQAKKNFQKRDKYMLSAFCLINLLMLIVGLFTVDVYVLTDKNMSAQL
jgi:hypothetical protein